MPQANALKSIGYMDILFVTIGKPDSYQLRSSGKSANSFFYLGDQKLLKLAADLPHLFCDRYPAYRYQVTVHLPHYQ
jgi:hypothetical protein